MKLCNRAMATSGIYFARKKNGGRWVSQLLDGQYPAEAASAFISVTVGAAECMTAEMATDENCFRCLRAQATPLLARYSADALVLEPEGAPSWMFHAACDTSRQI